jgi:hypothetical protein
MKSRNRIAMFAAAGVLVAGAALASPADARGYFGFSIVAPGYFAPPVVVDARAPNGYAAPYYAQPVYEDAYFDAPSYAVEGGPYYSARPYYFGADFHNSRAESYHRANFRNEDRGHSSQRSNDNGRRGDHR